MCVYSKSELGREGGRVGGREGERRVLTSCAVEFFAGFYAKENLAPFNFPLQNKAEFPPFSVEFVLFHYTARDVMRVGGGTG